MYSFDIIMTYETTAAAIVINYWPNGVHIAVQGKSNLYHIQSIADTIQLLNRIHDLTTVQWIHAALRWAAHNQ